MCIWLQPGFTRTTSSWRGKNRSRSISRDLYSLLAEIKLLKYRRKPGQNYAVADEISSEIGWDSVSINDGSKRYTFRVSFISIIWYSTSLGKN